MSREDLDRYRNLVEEHLLDFLPEIDNKSSVVYDSMKYSLTAGGKRIRPALLLASCEMCGGSINNALPYACALEYIHTYSLIHDDLPAMDDDELRRGKKTNHIVFGEAMAILAGDGLLNTAFEAMYKDMFMHFDDEQALKARVSAAYEIAKNAGCAGMIAGQVADIESEGKNCSGEMLDYIHINKTAALIVAAVRAGAQLASAEKHVLTRLTEYGECLGLAFQITDDLLDIKGDVEELGKETGMDQKNNKATYPQLYGLEASYDKVNELTKKGMEQLCEFGDEASFFRYLLDNVATRTK